MQREFDDKIHMLEELDFQVTTQHLSMNFDWFRAIRHHAVPNEKWHKHTLPELHFIIEGTVDFEFPNNKKISVTAGNAIIIPSSMLHRLSTNTYHFRYVIKTSFEAFTQDPETQLLQSLFRLQHPLCIPIEGKIAIHLNECMDEALNRKDGFHTIIESLLLHLLVLVMRNVIEISNYRHNYSVYEKKSLNLQRVENIVKYINKNPSSDLTLQMVADHLYLSKRQIQRIVTEQVGLSFRQLMRQQRYKQAKEMLKQSDKRIEDIAFDLGFPCIQSFCRFFSQMEGQPPAKYRKSIMTGSFLSLKDQNQENRNVGI